MTIPEILENDWFKKDYKPPQFEQEEGVSLDDVDAVFNDSDVSYLNKNSFFRLTAIAYSLLADLILFCRNISLQKGKRSQYL